MYKNPSEFYSIGLPDEDNIYEWDFSLFGPEESIFEYEYSKVN